MRPLVIAHRGFSVAAPENTLPAFRKALAAGADGLECDLRLTRDGRVAVIHDAAVDRTTDGRGRVKGFMVAALRRLDAGGWFGAAFSGARVPALEEVLALGRSCRLLILDVKDADPSWIGERENALRRLPVLIASEHAGFLKALRRRFPWARRALTATRKGDLALAIRLGCAAVDPLAPLVDAAFLKRARAAGLAVYPWTVDRAAEARRLARLGVDGIITNRPGPIGKVLASLSRGR